MVLSICRPSLNQRQVYNGHKKVHGIKFKSIVLSNGLIGNVVGPWEGRRHYCTMLHESDLLNDLRRVAWFNGQPPCIYGDPAYPMQIHLQTPYKEANLTRDQKNYNKPMKGVRVAVEWLFGEIKTYFKFADFKTQLKVGLNSVGKIYLVCGLLQNPRIHLYGNKVSEYFEMDPMTLEEYFQ